MKRSMKCLITLMIVAFIIVPVLSVFSNGVYAANTYRTVTVYRTSDLSKYYNPKTERIASSTHMVQYEVKYYSTFYMEKTDPLDLYPGWILRGYRKDTGGAIDVKVTSRYTNRYRASNGRTYPYTRGTLSATLTTGWCVSGAKYTAPSITVSYGNSNASFYTVMVVESKKIIAHKYNYNIVPITNNTSTSKTNTVASTTTTTAKTTTTAAKTTTTAANKVSYISISDDAKRLFVRSLYKNVLKREAANCDIDAHYTKPAEKIASDIMLSQEAEQKNAFSKMSNTEFTKCVYRYILGREADAAGLRDNIALLNKGKSRADLIQGFVGSKEFKDKRVIATKRITTLNAALAKAVCIDLHDQGYDSTVPSSGVLLMYQKDINNITSLNLRGKGATNYSGLNNVFPKLRTVTK